MKDLSLHTRLLAGAAAALATALLAACGGGGGAEPDPATVPQASCALGSELRDGQCVAFARRSVERMPTPWTQHGRAQTIELIAYRPLTAPVGRLAAIVVHHGSTGDASDPAQFKVSFDRQTLVRESTARGYLVFFPQRRGRGASDGVCDEGFKTDRSGYSCISAQALPGLLRAGEDAAVIAQAIESRSDVDPARLVLAGFSRGGLLALAHAAQRPGRWRAVVNVVGGWLGEACVDAPSLNRGAFAAGAAAPASLWLYGENDPFYSVAHSRANYDAFTAAGGRGQWNLLRRADPTASGHLVHTEPALWRALVDDYLAQRMR